MFSLAGNCSSDKFSMAIFSLLYCLFSEAVRVFPRYSKNSYIDLEQVGIKPSLNECLFPWDSSKAKVLSYNKLENKDNFLNSDLAHLTRRVLIVIFFL